MHAPERIVSLVPSLTEILFAVGAGPRVAAVTRYCTHPPDAVAGLPKVGGTKNPDLAAIRALAPDLVVMNAEENRREDHDALAAAGVPIFVCEPKTVAEGIEVIAELAAAAGCADTGRRLADAQRERVAAIAARVDARGEAVRVFCPIWKTPWMGFNADTYAHDVLRVAGGANVCAGRAERYPEVTLAEIAAADPEVIVLPDEPYRFAERDLPALAPLDATPAVRAARVHLVDGKALSWYGPRIADGVALFAQLFAR